MAEKKLLEIYPKTKYLAITWQVNDHCNYKCSYCNPGNRTWNNSNTPRIISGLDHESLNRMREFYESFCESLVEVDTPEIAEAAKMFENSFRQVNIALVNEFARYCHEVGR